MSSSLKRKSVAALPDCTCAICLDPLGPTDATFKGPCQHVFHIQCAETNFVVGRRNTCPLCRCVFEHAPGAVAMARAGASMRTPATRLPESEAPPPPPEAPAMPDVPVPESLRGGAARPLETDFAAAKVSLDTQSIEAGERKLVTALLTVRYKDDTEADRREMPSDFVLLADVSGSMSGAKIASLKEALLMLSSMFEPHDRVALVEFNDSARQLSPLAPLSAPEHEEAFRRAAMRLRAGGGTSIRSALRVADGILGARATRNPAAHVLVLTDGQDNTVRGVALAPGVFVSTLGFGSDHDAETLAQLAARGGGTYTFQRGTSTLDETLAAYVGDATRVLATDTRCFVEPAPGVTIHSASGPGDGQVGADGVAELTLGCARVDGTAEILLTFEVAMPADGPADVPLLRVRVSGAPATAPDAPRVSTRVLEVSLGAVARTDEERLREADAIAAASNREVLAAAAAAVAAARDAALVPDVISAATASMRGSAAAREPVAMALRALQQEAQERSSMFDPSPVANEMWRSARAQHALHTSPASRASKGGSGKRYTMHARKTAGGR
jgi:uncharacterized protein YegL